MNTGLHDAHNLAWKLALVCRGHATHDLLDSYESERQPVARAVAESGDKAEAGRAVTDPDKRAKRDRVLRCRLADPDLQHAQAVGAAELDVSYGKSLIVAGDRSPALSPGERLPETDPVRTSNDGAHALHELTHRCEHTVLVLGRDRTEVAALLSVASDLAESSPLVEAVIGLAPGGVDDVGDITEATLGLLGVDGLTVLVVRPDRFVAFRSDNPDIAAVAGYLEGPALGR